MKRFIGHKPSVKKASECETKPEKGVVDKKTGEHVLVFPIAEIKWVSDSEVEVSGGYYEGSLSASSNTYYLKKKDGSCPD